MKTNMKQPKTTNGYLNVELKMLPHQTACWAEFPQR